MKFSLKSTKAFEKDMKRISKSGKDLQKLQKIVAAIANAEGLAAKHRPHKLSGNWAGAWECHVEPDWLLIWYQTEDTIILERTGSHANLFN